MSLYLVGFLSVMIYCCGLMLDLGMMEIAQLRLQNAADAAAIGAVYAVEDGSTMTAGGTADAKLNNFVSGTNDVAITISNPPTSGNYKGNSSAVQVTITQPFTTRFIPGKFTLTAQATALVPPTPCVYFLAQFYTGVSLNAINETVAGNCPFYIGKSYYFNGGSSSSGNQFLLHGGASGSSGSVIPSPVHYGVMGDPLLYVAEPVFQSCTYTNVNITATTTLSPGTYCGGLTVNTPALVTLNPGTYIVLGNLNINGPTLKGVGVTFFMTTGGGYNYGTASITNVNATVSAPTIGTLQGIFFFSDRNMPSGKVELSLANRNPSSTVDGILYLAGEEIDVSNIPLKAVRYNGIVADNISIHNTGWVASSDYSQLANGNPFHIIGGGLVE